MIYVFGLILLMIGGVVYWATRSDKSEEVSSENDVD